MSDDMQKAFGSIKNALKAQPQAEPSRIASPAAEPPKRNMEEMRLKAEEAAAKWRQDNNVDENGDPIAPMKRRLQSGAGN